MQENFANSGEPGECSTAVMVVDDNEVFRLLLCRGLGALGYKVISAASGEEAVSFLCDCGVLPDVLLLDAYFSPAALTGFEVLSALRRTGVGSAKLPVVMMSTRSSAQHVELALQSGANACVSKPATSAEIHKRIQAVCSGGRSSGGGGHLSPGARPSAAGRGPSLSEEGEDALPPLRSRRAAVAHNWKYD